MNISYTISELVEYSIRNGLINEYDRAYATAKVMSRLSLSDIDEEKPEKIRPISEILDDITDYAAENGLLTGNTIVYRDLFDTAIMGEVTDPPSSVINKFSEKYKSSPNEATDYFYSFAKKSNYIREDRIKRDLRWSVATEYGELDISINLSKPEKDPKAIAAAKLLPPAKYPKCALCHENEGYAGNVSKPARQNLRQIPIKMGGELWYLQYSPYVYYNEHCIALSENHSPMKIERSTFEKLFDFITELPHYFIGSNADLPIVGGSILSHNHMQGGRYNFAMEKAGLKKNVEFSRYKNVRAGLVKWPLSVIRLTSSDRAALVELSTIILDAWRGYTDADAGIYSETDGEMHNTVTPIARRRGEDYEIDLVLRNNVTTDSRPLGVFHPAPERHNIKKENIGLIEVMGLAVLPARLKEEMALMKEAILNGKDFDENEKIKKHKEWFLAFSDNYTFTEENIEDTLKAEIGKTFALCLSDCAVFPDTRDGEKAFMRFIDTVAKV